MPELYILQYINGKGDLSIFKSPDISAINQIAKNSIVKLLIVKRGNTAIKVNFETGEIFVNNELYFKPNFRWINFKRHRNIIAVGSSNSIKHEYDNYIGWQITLGDKNFKKIVKIKPNGEVEEHQE